MRSAIPTLRDFAHTTIARGVLPLALDNCQDRGLRPLFVDATCGNGHDAAFMVRTAMPRLVERGLSARLLALDVQEAAIANTRLLLDDQGVPDAVRADLVQASHADMEQLIQEGEGVAVAMFNLGYLPGSDKDVITKKEFTIAALLALAGRVIPGGAICVHTYAGHKGGAEEAAAVEAWFAALPEKLWAVGRYSFPNKTKNPETLYLTCKLADSTP